MHSTERHQLLRPWFALHWFTWPLLAIVLAAIVWVQDYPDTILAEDGLSYHFGWPFLDSTMHSALVAAASDWPWDGPALVANLAVWVALLLSVAGVTESLRQPSGRGFRLSLQQLLGIVAAIAAVLAWRGLAPIQTIWLAELGSVELNTNFRSWPWPAQAPLLFAGGCAAYMAGKQVCSLFKWAGQLCWNAWKPSKEFLP